MTTLDAWGADVNGREIDRDGAYGAQCWDLVADYAERVVGCPVADFWTLWAPGTLDHTLVSSMWLYWPVKPSIVHYFVPVSRHEPIQYGDVLIWARSSAFPASHIAVATGPAVGGLVPCWTQNPGPAQHALLTTQGLLGILRPITSTEIEDDMYTDADRARDNTAAAEMKIQLQSQGRVEKMVHEIMVRSRAMHIAIDQTKWAATDPKVGLRKLVTDLGEKLAKIAGIELPAAGNVVLDPADLDAIAKSVNDETARRMAAGGGTPDLLAEAEKLAGE